MYSQNNFIFFLLFIDYSIFSISFSQEEPIPDFVLHLLRIRSLKRFRKLSLFRSVNDFLIAIIIRLALLTCSVMCMLKLSLAYNMTSRSFHD